MAYLKFLLGIRHQETQGATASMQNDPMLISCVTGLPEFEYYCPSGSPNQPVYRHIIHSHGIYIYSYQMPSTANYKLNLLDFPFVSPICISQQSIQLTPGPFPQYL